MKTKNENQIVAGRTQHLPLLLERAGKRSNIPGLPADNHGDLGKIKSEFLGRATTFPMISTK